MIHAYQPNRSELKILAGPPDNFKMHSLNGHVSTPIFNHLGSSSWHSYDAALIVSAGRIIGTKMPVLAIAGGAIAFLFIRRAKRRRGLRV
jgi:inositol phosphorylceramide mannosyltransferase catalytic subunit